MFLETGYPKVGGLAGMFGGSEPNHKRAALDFVAELTGSPRAGDKKVQDHDESLVHADELPVPMFGVDMNMRCTFWNRRATEATGWTEADVFSMPKFTASLFSDQDCEELLKAALEGQDSVQEIWSMKTKWEKDVNAVLLANARTDGNGITCGVVCVIMPLSPPRMEQPVLKLDCNVSAMDHMSILDLEEETFNNYGSPRGSEDAFLAALEQPPSPYFDGAVRDPMDMYGDSANTVYEAEASSVCSQDWCKSEQNPETLGGADNSLERSSLTQARAMVVDPHARGCKSLSLMLQRCGFEVSCASNGKDAIWTFEQSMQDPEGFSIVFINLDSARGEDYALIRQLRSMESSCGSPNITNQAVLVAVTDLDRWQDSTQKDVSAGLDAIINYPLRVQQLRDTLNSLDVQIDHLDFANKSPRASYNSWNNPLILAR